MTKSPNQSKWSEAQIIFCSIFVSIVKSKQEISVRDYNNEQKIMYWM